MKRLLALTLALLTAPGCFVAVGVDDSDGDPWWSGDHVNDPNDDDPNDPSDDTETDLPALDLTLTLDPGTVPSGTVSLVRGTLSGDADSADLVDLAFSDGITVLAIRHDDDGFDLAVDVPPGLRGRVDALLDLGDLGTAVIADALVVVAGDDTVDTGTDPSHDCP
ncbi:MAG: hypothetical protein H6733_01875 [Alphaproteobacteria bacterium]|nr:hypothetical protein [Alphaproteobacteria bacterium]